MGSENPKETQRSWSELEEVKIPKLRRLSQITWFFSRLALSLKIQSIIEVGFPEHKPASHLDS